MIDSEINPMAGTEQPVAENTRVFLSYSRKDMEFVDRLDKALAKRGIRVYIDRTEIEKGVDWWDRICQLIQMSDTVVFVLSPDAVQSEVCLKEVEYAVEHGKRLMPVIYRQIDNQEIPQALVSINYIVFAGSDERSVKNGFETAINELTTALLTDLPWVREHTRLSELARHWNSLGRTPDLLLHGDPLKSAISWLHNTLKRLDASGLEQDNALHLFIQSSARKHYKHGPFNWRSPIIGLPLILILTILMTVGLLIMNLTPQAPLLQALGLNESADYIRFALLAVAMQFIGYVSISVRRRYLVARNVNFLGVKQSRRFALRIVVYYSLCIIVLTGVQILLSQ